MNFPGSLHGHTHYSNLRLRDCIVRVDEAMSYAEELGHKVLAFTDHECVSSYVEIEKEMKRHPNLKVIRGNEIYLVRNGLNADNYNKDVDRYYHFILLAKDLIGVKQIFEISTRAWLRSYMARGMRRVPTYYQDLVDIIGANPGHVIGSTACLGGALPTQILRGTPKEKLDAWIEGLASVFGKENFFLEMQPSFNEDQIKVNKRLLGFTREHGLGYIITTDTHYLRKEDRFIHKAYLNAQNGDREVDDFYASTYMMGTSELESYFPYLSREELDAAYRSIEKIGDMCENYSIFKSLKIPDLIWKDFSYADPFKYLTSIPYMQTFMDSPYEGDRKLCYAIAAGIDSHPDLQNQRAYDEINSNLEMTWVSSQVNNAHWSAYYLNLQQIIDLCWEAGSIVGPGRGSGVGFILLYVLGITQINPLRETTRCFSWRFLNPERVSVLDVDFDIEGGRRAQVLSKFRQFYGEDRVANVATFRTEKSKSAIQTACRGLGIDVDVAQYLSSLIPADRGQLRSLAQCMYGDEENGWEPIKQFKIEMMDNYPEVWEVAQKIEGLICGYGIHAGGVIFVDEPFTNSTALMRAPDGTICTQFELHSCEDCSLIKYDALSVEAMDKIHICLDLLCEDGLIERKATLKETYEHAIGVYNLEREDPEMWEMVWEHKINSLFQMERQSGIKGIATLKPTSVDDLAILNSTIRLMAQEKGGEMPTDKLARFKADPTEWDRELESYGLGAKEKAILEPVLGMSYGLCIAQEQFMELVQLPELGGFSLTWADKLRKSIAKKNPKEYDALTKEFFEKTKEKGIDQNFASYVWNVLIAMSKGYGFNQSHTLAYSLIGLQEMNLAYKNPVIYWNCACLISDAGGSEEDEVDEEAAEESKIEEKYTEEMDWFDEDEDEEESSYDEDDGENGWPATIVVTKDGKKKKKLKATNYGKVASAIGKIQSTGVTVTAPDINKSGYTFTPDVENNSIRYGLSGITRIGGDLIKSIIAGRPYKSLDDFINRIKINKPQVINLIKSGAFDCFGERGTIMQNYIDSISGAKKRLTLQNMKMLIDYDLIPDELDMERRVFNFNKYLKKQKLDTTYYGMDNIAFNFFSSNFDIDLLVAAETESGFKIKMTAWDKIYQKHMDVARDYIKKNHDRLLSELNHKLTKEVWDKYCLGNISKWEMDSISCYIHEHELARVDFEKYHLDRYGDIESMPQIEKYIPIKGKMVPIFKLNRIYGTVLDRDKAKKTVTLLTTDGVVTVKIYGGVFAQYDKQISEKGADGKKHVLRKSEFSRGNKIIIIGVKDEDGFRAKKYSRTPFHLIETIENVDEEGNIIINNRNDEEVA